MSAPGARTTERRAAPLARVVAAHGRRRLVVAGVLWPALLAVTSTVAGGDGDVSLPLLGLFALVGAALLATYLPLTGPWYHLQAGCTRCAVVAGGSVPLGLVLLSSEPLERVTVLMALAVVSFGLAQRLRDPATCPTR